MEKAVKGGYIVLEKFSFYNAYTLDINMVYTIHAWIVIKIIKGERKNFENLK